MWAADAERSSILLSVWPQPTNVDILQSHDPWRPRQHWQDHDAIPTAPHSSDSYSAGNHHPPPPRQDGPSRPPPGLCSRHCASSSATSTEASQDGPVPRMIFSRAATLAAQRSFCWLRCRWDHNAVRRLPKPVRGNQVPTFGAANERRERPHTHAPTVTERQATCYWNRRASASSAGTLEPVEKRPAQLSTTLQGDGTSSRHKSRYSTYNTIS